MSSNQNAASHLEALPSELRLQLLLSMDLDTANCLSRASTKLRGGYTFFKDTLLNQALQGIEVDAVAYYLSLPRVLKSPLSNKKILRFLWQYDDSLRGLTPSLQITKQQKGDFVKWMTRFHTQVALPLMQDFAEWSIAHVARYSNRSGSLDCIELSASEKTRILRAIYRQGVFVNLFRRSPEDRRGTFNPAQVRSIFFRLLRRWDTEAVGCFNTFVGKNLGYYHQFRRFIWGSNRSSDPSVGMVLINLEHSNPAADVMDVEEIGDDNNKAEVDNTEDNVNEMDIDDMEDNQSVIEDEDMSDQDSFPDDDSMIDDDDIICEDDMMDEDDLDDTNNAQISGNTKSSGGTSIVNNTSDTIDNSGPSVTAPTDRTPIGWLQLKDTLRLHRRDESSAILAVARPMGFTLWDDERIDDLDISFGGIAAESANSGITWFHY